MADPGIRQRDIERLAAAFELTPREVVADAMVIWNWSHSTHELFAVLQQRHQWHPSMPPMYVAHLWRARLTPGQ